LILIIVIISGLLWGSFLSVVKNRLDDLGSIFFGRSHCPKCRHVLGVFDLIPIVSFLCLRGRCRFCHAKISLEYPFTEIISALLILLVYLKFGISFRSAILYLSLSALLVASLLDIDSSEVEVSVLLVGMLLALIWYFWGGLSFSQLTNLLWAILITGGIPFFLYLVSQEKWMGLGDTFFAVWIGILSGYPNAFAAIFLAFLFGAIFGIIKKVISGKSQERIPFGPFLAAAGVTGLFAGAQIVSFYLKLFGL
jgi:prepilin signal peptidase PulO-like enzyme (type II secretory pathway)